MVAVNEAENRILFGECKYREGMVGVQEYHHLRAKSTLVKWGALGRQETFALFSKSGFTKDLKQLAQSTEELVLIELDQ